MNSIRYVRRTRWTGWGGSRLGPHYADVALMEELLRGGLDWTAVGVPLPTDGPATGRWRTAYGQSVRRGYRISRADAAAAMLRALDQPRTVGASLAVAHWAPSLAEPCQPVSSPVSSLRARTTAHRGLPSPPRPRAGRATARTAKPAAVRSSRSAPNGLVR
jgi:hypothetical protein